MRRPLIAIAAFSFIALAGVYLTSPLWAAYKLREAVKTGDTAAVERMVVWPSLRASVKSTVARNAKLLPLAKQAARDIRPTMWQRVRSVFGHSMLDRFIETYITPQGLPKLYQAKTRWHERFKRPQKPIMMQAGLAPDRIAMCWVCLVVFGTEGGGKVGKVRCGLSKDLAHITLNCFTSDPTLLRSPFSHWSASFPPPSVPRANMNAF